MDLRSIMIAVGLLIACCAFGSGQAQSTDSAAACQLSALDLDASFFTSTALNNVDAKEGNFATATTVNVGGFGALQGLGVSSVLLEYPVGALNPPHAHPRGTEVLYVLQGELSVGLVDSNNRYSTQSLSAGNLFMFPEGLIHFQINDGKNTAKALAGFSNSNPGLEHLPKNLFKSDIPDQLLAKCFGVAAAVIADLKAEQNM